MDSKEIKEIMEYISKSNFVEFEIEREGFKLKLVKENGRAPVGAYLLPPDGTASYGTAQPPAMPQPGAPAAAPPAPVAPAADIFQVTSPMVGTFYSTPNPTSSPFVQVGDIVRKGQVICIIEAMKLMNEIESEVAGEVVDIPVSGGQPVEYGEVLFRIRVISS